ncbi:MAG: biliverdin-producing heme oxygenase [Azonexus sp.]
MNSASATIAARLYLRNGTHPDHVRLNQHPLLSGMTRPGYELASYQRVLSAYFHFYRTIEAAIDQALAAGVSGFVYEARRKLPWIVCDLEHFAIDPASLVDRPYIPAVQFSFADEGALLGTLYTIEGSSLGGQVISRYLAEHLALTPAAGGRFFHGYGAQTLLFWEEFETFLNAALSSESARRSALAAAKSTFAMMESVLDEYPDRNKPPSSP